MVDPGRIYIGFTLRSVWGWPSLNIEYRPYILYKKKYKFPKIFAEGEKSCESSFHREAHDWIY